MQLFVGTQIMRYVGGDSSVKSLKDWVDLKKGKRWRRKMADDELAALVAFSCFAAVGGIVIIIGMALFQ